MKCAELAEDILRRVPHLFVDGMRDIGPRDAVDIGVDLGLVAPFAGPCDRVFPVWMDPRCVLRTESIAIVLASLAAMRL